MISAVVEENSTEQRRVFSMGGDGESAKLSSTEDNTDQLAFTLGVFRED